MAHVKFDRVQETSTGTGTGALTLAGAVSKFRAYSAVLSNADTCVCLIEHNSAAEWEVSLCTYASGGNTLTRSTIYASSNGGSLVNFSAGTKTISLVAAASKQVVMAPDGSATIDGTLTVTYPIQSVFGYGSLTVLEALGGAGFRWASANDATARLQKTADGFATSSTPIFVSSAGKIGFNDTLTPIARVQITQADGTFSFGISGTSKGIRFSHDTSYSRIEGVDHTLGVSQQPIQIDGSIVQLLTANTVRWYLDAATGGFFGGLDNAYPLGGPSNRASVVYAGTGTINTSGSDAKRHIGEANDAEKRAAARIKASPRKYKFADAVEAKGDAARWHIGYVAEDVRDALAAEGLDPWSYGFMCADAIMEREAYSETVTRPKTRKVPDFDYVVEIRGGKPVRVRKQVERDEAVGSIMQVLDEDGRPVMVEKRSKTGEAVPVPLMHFVPEFETVEVETFRMVDSGRVRLGLRYSELEAFLRCAD